MDVVTSSVLRQECVGVSRVSCDFIEVQYSVKGASGSDPPIVGLPYLFSFRRGPHKTGIRSQCCAEDLDPMLVRARNKLRNPMDQIVSIDSFLCFLPSYIINAFKNNQVFNTALCDNIAVEARNGSLAISIVEHAIASNTFVEYTEVRGSRILLETCCQNIGPATIRIRGRLASICDGIAQRDNCRLVPSSACQHIDSL